MKILMAAGGTGGHIYPGIAISQQLKRTFENPEIIFVGSYVGMEKDIVPKAGYDLKLIRARGFEKGLSLQTLVAVKGVFDAYRDAKKLLKQEKPDLVIGTGGFTSAMLLFCAARMNIPTMIHEQNAYPGRSNRLTGKFVDRVGISFNEARSYFNSEKVFLAGNPIRDEFKTIDREESRKKLGLKNNDNLIIFMGGSQGAEAINQAAIHVLKNNQNPDNVYYILAGREQVEALERIVEANDLQSDRLKIFGYYEDMANLLAAGDLIICRSGAMSITEIAASGIPSILIPYPSAAGDHQTYNAKVLSENGGAILLPESELTGEKLLNLITGIMENTEKLETMRQNTFKQKILDADERFCIEAKRLVKEIKEE